MSYDPRVKEFLIGHFGGTERVSHADLAAFLESIGLPVNPTIASLKAENYLSKSRDPQDRPSARELAAGIEKPTRYRIAETVVHMTTGDRRANAQAYHAQNGSEDKKPDAALPSNNASAIADVRRLRVKDSVEYIFWLSANPFAKADNSKVLQEYSRDMKRLIKRGVKNTVRPSGHLIKDTFATDKGGSIPGNLIECGNNESNSQYIRESKRLGKRIHPARFPAELPRFFINFLTEPGATVLDPFAGSNTTGWVAESLGRKWLAVEKSEEYARDSELRFLTKEEAPTNGQKVLFR